MDEFLKAGNLKTGANSALGIEPGILGLRQVVSMTNSLFQSHWVV